MKSSIRLIALSAFVPVFAFAAQAQAQVHGEGPGVADIGPSVHFRSSAQHVKAEMGQPLNRMEGSPDVVGPLQSGLSREAVMAQAVAAAHAGGGAGEIPVM